MTRVISGLVVVCFVASVAVGQNGILVEMKKNAEIVAHVKVIELDGGEMDEVGVQEWAALLQVIDPIKGPVKTGDKIGLRFNRFIFAAGTEPLAVEKGKDYVVFLKGETGRVQFHADDEPCTAYAFLDRWVGALPYHVQLVRTLKAMGEDE
jgi:hypothetical protein